MKPLFALFDLLRLPWLFELLWKLVTNGSRLTQEEIDTATSVFGTNAIRYRSVRMATGGVLPLFFRLNKGRAFTTFYTVNLPLAELHKLDLLVHELAHVYQYEVVGSVYIPQALIAQRREGYLYGGWEGLVEARAEGKRLTDFNREQQALIAQDYYRHVLEPNRTDALADAYQPFIDDLRSGAL